MRQPGYGYKNWVRYECLRKKVYASKKMAELAMTERDEPGLNVYQCYHCRQWHIGHKSKMYA